VNTIVLPCDLHWDVTGITKVIRHRCPLPFYDKAGVQFRDDQGGGKRRKDIARLTRCRQLPFPQPMQNHQAAVAAA
jgi:hypothetical protein